MFNFNTSKIMNYKIENQAKNSTTNQTIYYAPVASTEGEKVKLYRYGFEQQCALFTHDILNEPDELKQCVIRYEFTKFIIHHYASYNGDRLEMLRGAALMISRAHDTLDDTLFRAKIGIVYTSNLLQKLKTKYKAALPQINAKQSHATNSTSTLNSHQQANLKEAQRAINEAKQQLRKYHRLYSRYNQICSETIAQEIVELDKYLEQMRY